MDPELAQMLKGLSPESLAKLLPIMSAGYHENVKKAFTQNYEDAWASVSVNRNGHTVEVQWKSSLNSPDYSVSVKYQRVEFLYDDGLSKAFNFPIQHGDGGFKTDLAEGRSYHFMFIFIEPQQATAAGNSNWRIPPVITVQVSIPLSPEKLALLKQAEAEEENPEEKINRQTQDFLKKQAAFDKCFKKGVENIKRKKLPKDEEEEKIEEFKEHIAWMKEQFGI